VRVICPNCRSEYEVEADRISRRGTRVKCSSCDNVFTVYRPEGEEESERGRPARRRARGKLGKLVGRKLYLRQGSKSYKIRDLALLQRWIIQKRVLATDELSVDGENWEQVYRLGELRPFFSLLRQLRETRRELLHTRERLREYEHTSMDSGDDAPMESGDDEGAPDAMETREILASAAAMEREGGGHFSLVDAKGLAPPSGEQPEVVAKARQAAAWEALESQELESPDEMIAEEARQQEQVGELPDAESLERLAARGPLPDDGTSYDPEEGTADSYDMVAPQPVAQVRPVGEEKSHESVEASSIEQPPIIAPEPDPVPAAADHLVSDLASREVEVPEYDPAAQSLVTDVQQAATVAWTPALDEEKLDEQETPAEVEAEVEPEPEAEPETEPETEPEAAEEEQEERSEPGSLGSDFQAFDESHEEPKPAERWEGDGFDAQYRDSIEEDEVRRISVVPYIAAAVILVVLIVLGAWYVVHLLRSQTVHQYGDFPVADGGQDSGDAQADPITPREPITDAGEPTPADEELVTGGDGIVVEDTTAEPSTDAGVPDQSDHPEPSTPEPSTPEPSTPEPRTPEPRTPEPRTPPPSNDGNAAILAETYNAQATSLARTGKHDQAIVAYRRALDEDPSNAEACKGIGWSAIELGQNGQAAEHFRRATILDAMDPENHYGLGLAYEGMERHDDAINEYQTYIGLAPDGREAAEVRILLRRLLEMRDGSPG